MIILIADGAVYFILVTGLPDTVFIFLMYRRLLNTVYFDIITRMIKRLGFLREANYYVDDYCQQQGAAWCARPTRHYIYLRRLMET